MKERGRGSHMLFCIEGRDSLSQKLTYTSTKIAKTSCKMWNEEAASGRIKNGASKGRRWGNKPWSLRPSSLC